MQALGAAKHRSHRFNRGANDVVVGILFRQAPAAGLAVGAQHQAFGVGGTKPFHDLAPQQASGPHLGHFQVEVHADGPEKTQARREIVHRQTFVQGGFHILLAVGQGQGQFQRLVGTGLLHVVTRNGDRVELRHVGRRVRNDVPDDAHAGLGRVDVGVAHHELFEDVVLDGAAELVLAHALLFGGHHITGQHRQHRAVHGHADAHLVQRNAVEQHLHVLHAVDGDAGFAHVARDAWVVAVISPMGGQIKSDADTLAARCERLAVKIVGGFGGGKAGVLADRPRPHRIHGGLRTAHKRRKTGQGIGMGHSL